MATLAFNRAIVGAGGRWLLVEWLHTASLGSVAPWDESLTPTLSASGGAVAATFKGSKQRDLLSNSRTLVSGAWWLDRPIAQGETVTIGSGGSVVGTDGTNSLGGIADGSSVMLISFVDASGEPSVPRRTGASPGAKTDPATDMTNLIAGFRASTLALSDGAALNTHVWTNGSGSNNITFGSGGTYRAAHADYGGQPALDWAAATETLSVGSLTKDCSTPLTLIAYLGYQTSTSVRSLRFGGAVAVSFGAQDVAPSFGCELCTTTRNFSPGGYKWADYTRPALVVLRWDPSTGTVTWFDRAGQAHDVYTGQTPDTPSGAVQIFARGTIAEIHVWEGLKTDAQIAEYCRWILDHYQDSARRFYLDSAAASDAPNGLTSATPKKNLSQVDASLWYKGAGDHLLIKLGSTYTLAAQIVTQSTGGSPEYPGRLGTYGDPADGPVTLNLPEGAIHGIFLQPATCNWVFDYGIKITSEVTRSPDSGSFVGYAALTNVRNAFTCGGQPASVHPLGHLTFMSDCRWTSHHGISLNCGTNTYRENLGVQFMRARSSLAFYSESSNLTGTRPSGAYVQDCRFAVFHESAFLRNGWCPELTRTVNITGNTAANPTAITLASAHNVPAGTLDNPWYVTIAGSNSTPSIDGTYQATRTGTTTFTIPVNVTGAGSAGTATWQPAKNNDLNHGVYYQNDESASLTPGLVCVSRCMFVGNGGNGAQWRSGSVELENIYEGNGLTSNAQGTASFIRDCFVGPCIPLGAVTGFSTSRDWGPEFGDSNGIICDVLFEGNILWSSNATASPNGGNCLQINVSSLTKRIVVQQNTMALWPGWCIEVDNRSGTFTPSVFTFDRNIAAQPSDLGVSSGAPQRLFKFDDASLSSFVDASHNAFDPTATGAGSAVDDNGSVGSLASYLTAIGDVTSVQAASISYTQVRTVTAATGATSWHAAQQSGSGVARDFVDDFLDAMDAQWDAAWSPSAILAWLRAGYEPTNLDEGDYGDAYVGAIDWTGGSPPPPPDPRRRVAGAGRLVALGVIGEQEIYAQ